MKLAPKQTDLRTLAKEILHKPKATATDETGAALTRAASLKTKAVLEYARNVRFTSWDDLEVRFNVSVPMSFKSQPMIYTEVIRWANWYVAEAGKATNDSVKSGGRIVQFPKLEPLSVGSYKLSPQQRKAVWQTLEIFRTGESCAVYNTMGTGTGKTIYVAAIIDAFQQNDYFGGGNRMPGGSALPMWNIIYVCPKGVQILTARKLAKAGVRDIGTDAHLYPYTSLRTRGFANLFKKVTRINPQNGQEQEMLKFAMGQPALVIFDEAHKLKKRDATMTRYCRGFLGPNTKFIFMSATPAIVVQDLFLFALASQKKFLGEKIDETNWPAFSAVVGKERSLGATDNASVKRVFDWFGDAIVNPPRDPQKFKAYNGVKLIHFLTPESRERYMSAQDNWLEMVRKFGNEPSQQAQVLIAFLNFGRTAEYESVGSVADLMMKAHAEGRAPVAAVRFRQTVKMLVAELAKRGVTRQQMTIIWGGEAEIAEKDIMPMGEWLSWRQRTLNEGWEWPSREIRTKFNKSEKYHTTRMKAERSVAEQRELDAWTSKMRLTDQTPEQRQDEIDNFQNGKTEFCIFTLAAGGTGIDLDHQVEGVRPRTLFAMPCYYAEEFIQAFGRAYRKFTLSDTYQYVVLFAGTIITNHMAPKLAKKLASVNKSTGLGLDLEAELTDAALRGKLESAEKATEVVIETDEAIEEEDDDDDDE